jgi:hypothetical protein
MKQPDALAAIDRLSDLPEGWDSYGAPQITEAALEFAKGCVTRIQNTLGAHYATPLVGPTPEGGVMLAWRKERGAEVDVLCSPSGGARFVVLSPHRQVAGGGELEDFGYFAIQVLKRLDL